MRYHSIYQWIGVCFLSVLAVNAYAQELVKWVDENGQVHYGDRIPPEYVQGKHEYLTPQAVVVKEIPAVLPVEEVRRLEKIAQKEREAEEALQAKKDEAYLQDKILLDTYTEERDIIASRDARLETIVSQEELAKRLIADQEEKLTSNDARIQSLRDSGIEVPENMLQTSLTLRQKLLSNKQFLLDKEEERLKIEQQFRRSIDRFRILRPLKASDY